MPEVPSRCIARGNPGSGPQHQQVIEQVGALAGKRRRVVSDTLDYCLDRLFAELLGNLGSTAGKEARRI
jgi:hypothetical protein